MIVYSTGLDANPETLIGRAKHALMVGAYNADEILNDPIGDVRSNWESSPLAVALDDMYDNVFGRHDEEGNRVPYPFHEVVTDLVALGFDVRDWTGAEVKSIIPAPKGKIKAMRLTFQSRTSPAKATIQVASHEAAVKYTEDMESSGLWLLVSWETLR